MADYEEFDSSKFPHYCNGRVRNILQDEEYRQLVVEAAIEDIKAGRYQLSLSHLCDLIEYENVMKKYK